MKDLPKHRSVGTTNTGTINILSSSSAKQCYNHNNNSYHPSTSTSTSNTTKSSSSSSTTLLSLLCNKRIRIVLATIMIMIFVLHHQIHFVWNFMLLHTTNDTEDTNIRPQQHPQHPQQRFTDITTSKTSTTTLSRGNDRQITSSSSAVTIDTSSSSTQPTTTTSSSSTSTTSTLSTTTEIWPPMDMIHHIWDNISTNLQDQIQRRLVIAASNGQYTDFAINFIKSLQQHNVYNFVIVPLDNTAYSKLKDIYPHHTMPVVPELANLRASSTSTTTDTKEEAASFRSKEFEIVTSTRPIFLNYFLQQNITIFYNDIDMVWQYNAWNTIDTIKYKTSERIDTTTSTVTSTDGTNNNNKNNNNNNQQQQYDVLLWMDGPVQICTCLLYMVPSITSNIIINEWKYEIQTHLYPNDQKAFLIMAQKYNLLPSKQQQQKLSSQQHNTMKSKQQQLLLLKQNVQLFQNNEQFPTGAMYDWEQQIQLQQQSDTSNEQQEHVQQVSQSQSNNNDWKQFVPNTSKSYIKQQKYQKTNPIHAIIIHNNWIEGKQSKIQRFILSKLWFV